ncbi:hypothetical protein AB1L88_15640 [Tautonia sp. JC769]|uniref:hypothetical protein n=1 Tax=Tautonia sp. JC769 TaxID=3232135 RepID=UPI003459F8A4
MAILMRVTRIKAGEADRTLVIRADRIDRLEDAGTHRVVEMDRFGRVYEVRDALDDLVERWQAALTGADINGAEIP